MPPSSINKCQVMISMDIYGRLGEDTHICICILPPFLK
jgi:hypothetical protein